MKEQLRSSGWYIVFGALFLLVQGCGATPLGKAVKTDYDVIVVGAGMGGLSAGAHLATEGKRVLVLEQHYKIGGCTSSFVRGEFAFDTALHEMSVGGGNGFIRQLLKKVGIYDKVEMIRVPSLGRSIFPDMELVQLEGVESFKSLLVARWPQEKEGIDRYFNLLEAMSIEVAQLRDIYFSNPVKALLTKMAIPLRQRHLAKYYKSTLQEVLDEHFHDKKLKAAIAQFWVYHGPPPSRQWAIIYMLGQHSYLKNGGWQFRGSSSSLSEAYADRIRELGGTVKTGTLVKSIIVEDGKVHGVVTKDGEQYSSRFVVSNADPYQTFYKLVGIEKTPRDVKRQLDEMIPSTSLAGVYLGLDVPAEYWGIDDYEVFYNTSWDHEEMHEAMINGRYDKGMLAITFYSNLPDDFYAAPDKASIVLNTYSDYDYWSDDPHIYAQQKDHMISELIKMAENVMPGLSNHIVYQEGMTPRTIRHYTMNYKGAPYGMAANVAQRDRFDNKTDIAGLYMAGSWAFPAHSVGMAQVSGFMVSKMIVKADTR